MSASVWSNAIKYLALCLALTAWLGCTAVDRPAGVSRGITFSVTPLYPNGYDLVASGGRDFAAAILKDAWSKKAAQLTAGRKYKSSALTVHDTEIVPYTGYPTLPERGRSVSGTITILK